MTKPKGYGTHKNGKKHPVFEKKGINESDMKISVKGNNDTIAVQKPKSDDNIKKEKGTMFWHNGKAYHVEIRPDYVSVDERFQDGNNKWHNGKTVYFAQGGEQIAHLESEAGGLYVDKILEYLDSGGALEEPDKTRKDQSLSDLKWNNFTSYARTYDSLNNSAKEQLLIEAGIPMKNYEVSTIQDARMYVHKSFNKLPDLTQKRIKQKLFKIMDNQLHNEAYTH